MRSARRAHEAAQRAGLLILVLLLSGCSQTVVTQPPPDVEIPSYCKRMSKPVPPLPERPVSIPQFVEEGYGRLKKLYLSEAGRADACRRFASKLARRTAD